MADQKLTQLTAITSVTDDDLLYVVDDPAGTPLSRQITVLDFKGSFGLTDFSANGNWKVFYSDGSGNITELALGAANTVLTSSGATSAPSFTAVPGDGDGIYDGNGTVPSSTISTLTDTWQINGDVGIGAITPLERLHVDGNSKVDGFLYVDSPTNNGQALRVDADNWSEAFVVHEDSDTVYVGIAAPVGTRSLSERFRVNGNAVFTGNIAVSGATTVGSAINLGTDDFIGIGGVARYGSVSGDTNIDASSSHIIQLRDGNNAVYALFDQDIKKFKSRPATSGATLRDEQLTITAQYWNGATLERDYDIVHNVTVAGASPASQVEMSIAGTLALTLQDSGYPEVPTYTVAGVPAVGSGGGMIFVSDETGGATLAFSDGTNWRRVQDRAIVS